MINYIIMSSRGAFHLVLYVDPNIFMYCFLFTVSLKQYRPRNMSIQG